MALKSVSWSTDAATKTTDTGGISGSSKDPGLLTFPPSTVCRSFSPSSVTGRSLPRIDWKTNGLHIPPSSPRPIWESCKPKMLNKICSSFLLNAFLERFLYAWGFRSTFLLLFERSNLLERIAWARRFGVEVIRGRKTRIVRMNIMYIFNVTRSCF